MQTIFESEQIEFSGQLLSFYINCKHTDGYQNLFRDYVEKSLNPQAIATKLYSKLTLKTFFMR